MLLIFKHVRCFVTFGVIVGHKTLAVTANDLLPFN